MMTTAQVKTQPKAEVDRYKVSHGYLLSLLLAFGIGIAGGMFEALWLWPHHGIVTLTVGPDVAFLMTSMIALAIVENERVKMGIALGVVNVVVTAVVSFLCFLAMVDSAGGLIRP